MPDPIQIQSRLAWKHCPEAGLMILTHQLASRPDPFGQNLTQSPRDNLNLGWFCTIWSGTSVEECNQVWKRETGSRPVVFCQNQAWWFLQTSLLPDQMHLAKPWPGRPDWICFGLSQYDLGLLWKHKAESDVESWIWHKWSGLVLAACWPYRP